MRCLSPTKQKFKDIKMYGFDIETCNKNKDFLMASVVDNHNEWVFYDKQELIDFFKTKKFWNSYVIATNLQFDFFGTFFGSKEAREFKLLFRGSELLYSLSYIKDKKFRYKPYKSRKICFIDTMNYVRMSVDNLGKIIGVKKLKDDVKSFIGERPQTQEQWEILKRYNVRDSQISLRIMEFLYDSFIKLGANCETTIAKTSLSLFKNKYLKTKYYGHNDDILLSIFKGYYGGDTQAYVRGKIENSWYYDFNSLYPSVMLNEYPNPNSLNTNHRNTIEYIQNFEGMADVEVSCPYMDYPLLPSRINQKLIFGYGTFRGYYTNLELRKAIELGYVIKKVYHNIYYKQNCRPFYNFVMDLYDKRKQYKEQGNKMEKVVKLLMNSLYGKFGQKFIDRDNWEYNNYTLEELHKLDYFETFGDFIRVKKAYSRPGNFCIPIWAAYTTAYGRLKLHQIKIMCDPQYNDTDSVFTRKKFAHSNELGKLGLECQIKSGVIVKSKFYYIDTGEYKKVVIKGLGGRLNYDQFIDILENGLFRYEKFMKLKESMRRNFTPNEIVDVKKMLDMEDDKRKWDNLFNPDELQFSKPLLIEDGMTELMIERDRIKAEQDYQRRMEKDLLNDKSDFFDSMGDDISKQEFFERETEQ